MKFEIKERVFLVQKFYELKNISLIQRAFRVKFPNQKAPSNKVIKYIISVFEKTGSVQRQPPKPKEPSKKRKDAKSRLETLITEMPKLSIRKAASAIGVSPTLVYHVLHDDLHLKPYKFHQWHKLEETDYGKRLFFAQWFLNLPKASRKFCFFSDEAYFYLTLPPNKQNNRQWGSSQLVVGTEKPLHDEKVLVWCAISANGVFGPFFFKDYVNQHNYLEMLKENFWPKVLRTPDYKKYYFQQDGARPHTAIEVQKW